VVDVRVVECAVGGCAGGWNVQVVDVAVFVGGKKLMRRWVGGDVWVGGTMQVGGHGGGVPEAVLREWCACQQSWGVQGRCAELEGMGRPKAEEWHRQA